MVSTSATYSRTLHPTVHRAWDNTASITGAACRWQGVQEPQHLHVWARGARSPSPDEDFLSVTLTVFIAERWFVGDALGR